jgi:hypothetical protein
VVNARVQFVYLCHNWPRIRSVCRNINPVISSFLTYHRVCDKSSTTGATRGTGTAFPSSEHGLTPFLSGIHVAWSLVFSAMFCKSLFFHLSFVLSVILRFMASDYLYDIFKLFIQTMWFFKWFHGAMIFHQYYI